MKLAATDKKNIFIFDQAEAPGGSVDRIIEIMNALDNYHFVFATIKPLNQITKLELHSHIEHVLIHTILDGHQAFKIISRISSVSRVAGLLTDIYFRIVSKIDRSYTERQIKTVSDRLNIDLVQSNSDVHSIPFRLAFRLNAPLISFMRSQLSFAWWSKDELNKCSKFICVSNALKDHYIEALPVNPGQFEVIHSPFDAEKKLSDTPMEALPEPAIQLLENRNPTACHAARFCEDKGQLNVAKALRKLKDNNLIVNVIFVGPFETSGSSKIYQAKVLKFIDDNDLNNQVAFLGHRRDVMHIMKAGDFFLHTAPDFEGLGGTVIEAIQLGKFVVSSNYGGPLEIVIEGKTGVFFERNDPFDLAVKIEDFLAIGDFDINQEERNSVADRFSPNIIINNISKVYEELLYPENRS